MWQAIVFVISEKFAQLLFLLLWLLLLLRSSRPGKECGQLVKCYDKWVESKPNCVCGMWCSSRWGSAKRTTSLWHEGSEALKQQRQQVEELNQTKRNVCVVIVPVSSMQVINSQAKYTNAYNFVCMYVGRHFYIAVCPHIALLIYTNVCMYVYMHFYYFQHITDGVLSNEFISALSESFITDISYIQGGQKKPLISFFLYHLFFLVISHEIFMVSK